ncbi:MAG: gliding motility protein GldL [Prevotella sp.]|nr:gliding motility protein GldL [Prevotella sp.]
MTQYSKLNIVYRLQKWMDSVPGQTFLNYAYSWGAAIVILGTLFKLTHIPGANFWLFLGMGTEVVVFFLSAFDRPFDKTADGMDLARHLENEGAEDSADSEETGSTEASHVVGGGTIVINGGGSAVGSLPEGATGVVPGGDVAVGGAGGGAISFGGSAPQSASPELEEATSQYIDELKKLTELLQKVGEQSERLTRDSEEMENLNRTLTGISRVYEMQLKSASQQIGTIDQINDQTRHMAEQIAELNKIYARMIEAMTVNMPGQVKGE